MEGCNEFDDRIYPAEYISSNQLLFGNIIEVAYGVLKQMLRKNLNMGRICGAVNIINF